MQQTQIGLRICMTVMLPCLTFPGDLLNRFNSTASYISGIVGFWNFYTSHERTLFLAHWNTFGTLSIRRYRKQRRQRSRIPYYANSIATFQLLLRAGDVAENPGPEKQNPLSQRSSRFSGSVCPECDMTVRRNQKRFICTVF